MPERLTDCQILKIASCNATRRYFRQPPLASQVLEEGSPSLTIPFPKWRLALFAKPANESLCDLDVSYVTYRWVGLIELDHNSPESLHIALENGHRSRGPVQWDGREANVSDYIKGKGKHHDRS